MTKLKKSNEHASATFNGYLTAWPDLLFMILDKLLEPIDHVRCAVVCKQWQSLAKQYNVATQRWSKVLPMLMISAGPSSALRSLSEEKRYIKKFQLPCKSKRFCGSSHGWLAVVNEISMDITLVNPFARAMTSIRLPHLDGKVSKVILSADPALNPTNYMVVAIYNSKKLAFLRGGEEDWSRFHIGHDLSDVIFHKNKIYMVSVEGSILSMCVIYSRLRVFRPHTSNPYDKYQAHIVESTKGDLWHVLTCGMTLKVYKVVFSDEDGSMVNRVKVESIGDEALFLGKNYSISLSASKFPGCRPNSVYYTGDSDIYVKRIFDVELGRAFARYYLYPSSYSQNPPGLWITPQFKGLC